MIDVSGRVKKIVLLLSISLFFFSISSIDLAALNSGHIGCSTCHQLHNAPGQTLGSNASDEVLCLSCHGPAGTATVKDLTIHTNKTGSSHDSFAITCTDCHNAHHNVQNYKSGTNIKQVGTITSDSSFARIKLPSNAGGGTSDVLFEQRGSDADSPYNSSLRSFADGDEDGDGKYEGVCEVCHTQAANHRNNSSGNHDHYKGQNCISCHSHEERFEGTGGGCTGCHSSAQGSRRAIVGEFGLTSHHVSSAVTDADCKVCHHEAMDDGVGGITIDSTYHNNVGGYVVDLRGPDDNSVISFVAFSRNTSSDSLESWVTDVQDNFCMKCHDSDGATSSNISGNALRPFSSGTSDVPNVFDSFNTNNAMHHAVRGAGDNPYCVPSSSNGTNITMESPWNQDSTHDVISCFDCHSSSGHGGANQRMLRTSIDLDGMESGTLSASTGADVETYCTVCHKASVYIGSSDPEAVGSIFEYHGSGMSQHTAGGQNELGCMGCHGGIYDHSGGVPPSGNDSARGNIHGKTFTWPSGTFSAGVTTEHFMLGGWIDGWNTGFDNKGNPEGYCGGGDCNHSGSATKNGQKYSR